MKILIEQSGEFAGCNFYREDDVPVEDWRDLSDDEQFFVVDSLKQFYELFNGCLTKKEEGETKPKDLGKAKTLRMEILIDVDAHGEKFPLSKKIRNDDNYRRWCVDIDIETGVIKNWPKTTGEWSIFEKVRDEGKYWLLDENGEVFVAMTDGYYVPNKIVPPKDGYGDYIDLNIDSNGKIINWYKNPSVEEFFLIDN